MSEDNQEDLSVEDILSSIKNILVEEEGETPQKTPEKKKEEDVLDLESSMIVDANQTSSGTDIENLLKDITEPVITEEPISETAQKIADDINVEQTVDIASQINLDNLAQSPTETITETESQVAPELAQETDDVKEDAIDASASIISNFAKVFAEKKQSLSATPQQHSDIETNLTNNIEQLGISSMVKEAIITQVKTCLDSHFEQIASKIIAEQTSQWLNEHLASIVEKTVAKEIERVIAKVGS